MVRHPPADPAQTMAAAPPARRASPSALRASPSARRRRGDGPRGGGERDVGPREARDATQPGQPEVSPGATAPRACKLRVGISVKWPRADVPGSRARRDRALSTVRPRADHAAPSAPRASPSARRRSRRRTTGGGGGNRQARRLYWRPTGDGSRAPPRSAHPHPPAGGRGDGARAAGTRNRPAAHDARSALYTEPGTGKHRPAHLRHGRTGCASAARRSGRAATLAGHGAMVRHLAPAALEGLDGPPSARRAPHPHAGGRGDGPRAAGAGTGRGHRLRVGIPARWPRADVPGSRARVSYAAGQPRADHGCAPSARRASPSARRRARRRNAGGGRRNGPLAYPRNSGSRKNRPAHLRHGRAGCASASR